MPVFQHQTIDSTGRRQRGRTNAETSGALVRALKRSGHIVLEIPTREEGEFDAPHSFGRDAAILEFTRACAALLKAGMPISRVLSTASLVTYETMRPTIEAIPERVERGTSLANCAESGRDVLRAHICWCCAGRRESR